MTSALDALLNRPAALEQDEADTVRAWVGRAGLELASVKPLPTSGRDAEQRPAAVARLDTENRISAGKATSVLGWAAGDPVHAEVDRSGLVPVVVLAPGEVTGPHQHPVPLDKVGRLRLAPALIGALRLRAGDQLQLVALPQRDRVVVYALADIAPLITAALFPALPHEPAPEKVREPSPPARRTHVRRPWRPPTAAAS